MKHDNLDKPQNMTPGLPWWLSGKESTCQCRRPGFDPWVRKIPWRRKWQPTPVFLPGESPRQKSLVGYSPRGHKKSGTIELLSVQPHRMKTQLLCIERCAERDALPGIAHMIVGTGQASLKAIRQATRTSRLQTLRQEPILQSAGEICSSEKHQFCC